MESKVYTPCGGCGATEPDQRCIGCMHPFTEIKPDELPVTPEWELINRIVSQWGNAVEMPNMEQWLKDYAAKAQPGAVWVKADTKPEHSVGVLVFIPGEDNHITSGMWDISNKWVLLDEYRTPEEEVTYWMPLPAFPEGYPAYELPDEIGAMIKKIAREELGKKEQPAAGREDAVEFAEWLLEYRYEPSFEKKWVDYSKTGDNRVSSAQLYELFKQQKEK